MKFVFLSLYFCAALSPVIAQPSLPDSDLANVDALYPLVEPTASDDLSLFDETQGEPLLLTSNPSIYPESTNEVQGDDGSQTIPIEATSPYEAANLEGLGISTTPDEPHNPSIDGTISGNLGVEAFPWDGSFSLEEAFPPIEKVIPLGSTFGLQDDSASRCRDQLGKWPLCCRGQWNGGGQRNVDNCDLCRLPPPICCCVVEYGCHVEQLVSLTYRAGPPLLIHSCAQMTLTTKLGYVQFPYGNFAVKDISLGYVRQS